MPKLQVTTISAEEVWAKGDLTISKLLLDVNGEQVQAKTYSKVIATPGWSGIVEPYEKTGRNGIETFVKQPQKEGGYQPQGGGGSRGGASTSTSKPQDNYTMYLSYVKDVAVALINGKAYTVERLNEIVTDIAASGEMFYAMRPDGSVKKEEPIKDELDDVFGSTEELQGETPWNPTAEPQQLQV